MKHLATVLGVAVLGAIVGVSATLWAGIFTIPMDHRPTGPTCVCPQDNGRAPSRQPTEEDYYSRPTPR